MFWFYIYVMLYNYVIYVMFFDSEDDQTIYSRTQLIAINLDIVEAKL